MKKNKKILLILALVLAFIAIVLAFIFNKKQDSYSFQPESDNVEPVLSQEMTDKERFENFLRENISLISPQAEVLGGKFYVTTITWQSDRDGIVAYEDGHIALEAQFSFSFADDSKSEIVLNSFTIIE